MIIFENFKSILSVIFPWFSNFKFHSWFVSFLGNVRFLKRFIHVCQNEKTERINKLNLKFEFEE